MTLAPLSSTVPPVPNTDVTASAADCRPLGYKTVVSSCLAGASPTATTSAPTARNMLAAVAAWPVLPLPFNTSTFTPATAALETASAEVSDVPPDDVPVSPEPEPVESVPSCRASSKGAVL